MGHLHFFCIISFYSDFQYLYAVYIDLTHVCYILVEHVPSHLYVSVLFLFQFVLLHNFNAKINEIASISLCYATLVLICATP